MSLPTFVRRLLLLLAVLAGLFAVFVVAQARYRSWGATEAERTAALPGDDIVPLARSQETRAITIQAPAAAVWPWLAQLGQDRGGFYSYELLEDLVGCEMENLDRLEPSLQEWKPGDRLWMYPPDKLGEVTSAPLVVYEPGRVLGFATRQIGTPLTSNWDGSWTFIVEPIDARSSRLIVRGRAAGGVSAPAMAFTYAVFDPMHFVMERKMMEVLKARAEGRPVSELADNVQIGLWTVCFVLFVVSAGGILFGREMRRNAVLAFASGLLFHFLTFVQPTLALGVPLVALLVGGYAYARRARQARGGQPRSSEGLAGTADMSRPREA